MSRSFSLISGAFALRNHVFALKDALFSKLFNEKDVNAFGSGRSFKLKGPRANNEASGFAPEALGTFRQKRYITAKKHLLLTRTLSNQ